MTYCEKKFNEINFALFLSGFPITVTAQATRPIVKDFDSDLKNK